MATSRQCLGIDIGSHSIRIAEAWKAGGRTAEAVTRKDGSFSMAAPLAAGEKFALYLVDSMWVLAQKKTGQWIDYPT